MKYTAKLITIVVVSFLCVALTAAIKKHTTQKRRTTSMKIAMIIAKNGFRDEEYLEPKEIFIKSGFEVETFSSSTGTAKGMIKATVEVKKSINELKVDDYDAIIFVGGVGSSEYWENSLAHKIAKEAVEKDKVLAAICIAPITLAKAGVLKGKKATVFSSEVTQLKALGAIYTAKDVETDGKIVTASGTHAAKQFGEKIKELLLKK